MGDTGLSFLFFLAVENYLYNSHILGGEIGEGTLITFSVLKGPNVVFLIPDSMLEIPWEVSKKRKKY